VTTYAELIGSIKKAMDSIGSNPMGPKEIQAGSLKRLVSFLESQGGSVKASPLSGDFMFGIPVRETPFLPPNYIGWDDGKGGFTLVNLDRTEQNKDRT
jgi:hypothetical protein